MPTAITFVCSTCFRPLRVAAKFAGLLIRCLACRALTQVPGERQVPVRQSDDDPTTPLHPKTKRSPG